MTKATSLAHGALIEDSPDAANQILVEWDLTQDDSLLYGLSRTIPARRADLVVPPILKG